VIVVAVVEIEVEFVKEELVVEIDVVMDAAIDVVVEVDVVDEADVEMAVDVLDVEMVADVVDVELDEEVDVEEDEEVDVAVDVVVDETNEQDYPNLGAVLVEDNCPVEMLEEVHYLVYKFVLKQMVYL
jgi:hypothetical protein